jgi:hypothetical protein
MNATKIVTKLKANFTEISVCIVHLEISQKLYKLIKITNTTFLSFFHFYETGSYYAAQVRF